MASQIDICNQALMYCGADMVLAITGDSVSETALAGAWDMVRDELLAVHPWGFAMQRTTLALSATAPTFDYLYAWPLPSDCIRILEVKSGVTTTDSASAYDVQWVMEGGNILTNVEDIELKYIYRVTAAGLYPPGFVAAFAARLGAAISLRLTDSNQRFTQLYQLYERMIARAKLEDATQENLYPMEIYDSWLFSRGGMTDTGSEVDG